MKILVTGSSGFIGRWVSKYLTEQGCEVTGLDMVAPIGEFAGPQRVCNILDGDKLIATVKECQPDGIIHLAARTDLDEKNNLNGYAANIDGVRNLIAAVRQSPSVRRVIYTSSQLVCKVGHVPKGVDEYCPNTLYGESKVLTERIVREADGGGVDWCLVRPTSVWGPGMSPHYQRMLALIQRRRYFHCGSKPLFKSYSYAGNIAFQYLQLLRAPATAVNRRTLYLADYEPLCLQDYTNEIARELGAKRIPTLPMPAARLLACLGDMLGAVRGKEFPFNSFRLRNIATEYVFDLSATRTLCGELPYTWLDGVKATTDWYRNPRPLPVIPADLKLSAA